MDEAAKKRLLLENGNAHGNNLDGDVNIEDEDKNEIVRGSSSVSYEDISNKKYKQTNVTVDVDVPQNR